MKLNAYVIYDNKAKIYNKPFFFVNDSVALRAAQDLVNDRNTDVHSHPEDFTLWRVGSYDDVTARFEPEQHHEHLLSFKELPIAKDPNQVDLEDLLAQMRKGEYPSDEDITNAKSLKSA